MQTKGFCNNGFSMDSLKVKKLPEYKNDVFRAKKKVSRGGSSVKASWKKAESNNKLMQRTKFKLLGSWV